MSTVPLGDPFTAEEREWIEQRQPHVGGLANADDCFHAYVLRKRHTSYKTLTALFACSKSSVRRAIALVSGLMGDDPREWQLERRKYRRETVASFWTHSKKIHVRQQAIAEELRELRRAQGVAIEMPPPLQGPRDAYAEQARLEAHEGAPQPSFASHLRPARKPVNPFDR